MTHTLKEQLDGIQWARKYIQEREEDIDTYVRVDELLNDAANTIAAMNIAKDSPTNWENLRQKLNELINKPLTKPN